MRATTAILLLLAAPAAGSQESGPAAGAVVSPGQLIADCIESTGDEVGLDQLEARCPGIGQAIAESGYGAFISEAERESLTAYSLEDLQNIQARYSDSHGSRSAQQMLTQLDPVLESLQQERPIDRPPTLFERFKRWLQSFIDRQQQDQDSWLGRWLRDVRVSEQAVSWLLYGLVALVIVLAIGVVWNEVRAAGLLGGARRRRAASIAAGGAAEQQTVPTLADLERAPVRDRPSLLLRILIAKLVETGRLRTEKSLTHRELGALATFDAADQRDRFRRVAMMGERLLYGGGSVSDEEIASVVHAGSQLDAQLSAPRRAQ